MNPEPPIEPASGRPGRQEHRPVVALLVAHWEAKSEEGWITRQVTGALSCVADVHVVTPDGNVPGTSVDSVFTLHRLATPVDPLAELRRDLLVEAVSASFRIRKTGTPSGLQELIDEELIDPWNGASDVLTGLQPDLVVVVGHQNRGALVAVDRMDPGVAMTLLALGSDADSVAFPLYDDLVERSSSVLAVTETERVSIVESHGIEDKVHRIGAPLVANPSVLGEPNTWVGDNDTIMVLTGVTIGADHEETELSRLLRLRFPDNPVGIVHSDAFDAWHQGRLNRGWAVERSSDLARLMAWARVTVDLRPGRLFARRCIDSLLYGTPIVVPHDSRAREHAERGRGGLWFASPAELTWCVEALLEPSTHDAFADQGVRYAEAEYGSTDRFIDRVVEGCGLASDSAPVRITA